MRAADPFAAYDARQDSLRAANAPEPVDLFEPFELPDADHDPDRERPARPGLLAAAGRLRPRGPSRRDHAHLTGTVSLRYTNNSPETLDYLWFHLEQNLFESDSRGGPVSGRAPSSLDDAHGYRLGAVTVDGRAVEPLVTDTRMRLDLPGAPRG